MFKIVISFILLTALRVPFLYAQDCLPSANSCDFYSCFENKVQCGPLGYPLQFGEPNCKKFLAAEPQSSLEIQDWYPKVRLCLQESLERIAAQELSPNSCLMLEQQAFYSHVDCYIHTGFCELSKAAKKEIMKTGGLSLFSPLSIKTAFQIQMACRRLKGLN